jgi:hypothetical protein
LYLCSEVESIVLNMKRNSGKVFFMHSRPVWGTLFLSLLLVICNACADRSSRVESNLLIGMAEVNYTPSVGLDMVGNYRGDDYGSRGVHDSLYARAIVAEDKKGEKAAILSVDICYLKKEAADMMREYIASRTDIPIENIMIHGTHTHSGPRSDLAAPEAEDYLKRASDAVILAGGRMKPTLLSIGRTTEDRVSFNRRLRCKDGTTRMVWEGLDPDFVVERLGSKDTEMITVSLDQQGGSTGVMVNFACHPTNLTGSNWLWSADYPGDIAESLKKVYGKDYIPMFINGCCGNVTQVDYKKGFTDTFEECERMGYILGVDAITAIRQQEAVPGDIIAVSSEMVPVKHISISDEQLAWAQAVMKKVEEEGMPPLQQDGIPDAVYAQKWVDMYKTQQEYDSLEVQVIRIGNVAFVGLPGEMFAEFGMKIKAESPFEHTIVMGLANDSRGYFPTREAYTEGPEGYTPMITGYETTPGTSRYEIGAGEQLTASAIEQLNKIF